METQFPGENVLSRMPANDGLFLRRILAIPFSRSQHRYKALTTSVFTTGEIYATAFAPDTTDLSAA